MILSIGSLTQVRNDLLQNALENIQQVSENVLDTLNSCADDSKNGQQNLDYALRIDIICLCLKILRDFLKLKRTNVGLKMHSQVQFSEFLRFAEDKDLPSTEVRVEALR